MINQSCKQFSDKLISKLYNLILNWFLKNITYCQTDCWIL